MRLKGKTALIAGAARESGSTIAHTFAREGADLVLIAQKSGDALDRIAAECAALGVKALPLLGDLSREDEVNRMTREGLARFGRIDILVVVAATRPPAKPAWEYASADWLKTFDVNLHAAFYLAKALAPGMIERKSGSIIALNGSSLVTVSNTVGLTPPAAGVVSKIALHALIKSLALSLAPYGVRANSVGLANVDNTDRNNPKLYQDRTQVGVTDKQKQESARVMPMNRKCTYQEMANVVLFLASDESSYVTGDRILCTGGLHV